MPPVKYKIVGDSCFDRSAYIDEYVKPQIVPLTIRVDELELRDDERLDPLELIRLIKESKNGPKTAAPSPHDFLKSYEGADNVFVVTLSSNLSGTYSSAMVAKTMKEEGAGDTFVHVFDSRSATSAETLIGLKIRELAERDVEQQEIVDQVEEYISSMNTLFILESLDTLIKAGRISRLAGLIGNVLSIKPVMGADKEGNIYLVEKARGSNRAFGRLVELVGERAVDMENRVLGISHVNCREKAERLRDEIREKYSFRDVIIVEARGITTVYAGEGGIVVAF